MALPKKLRLARRDFLIAKLKGRRYSQRLFSAVYFNNNVKEARYNRYGVVVSKKIHQNAVIRNRLKRLIFSCLSFSGPAFFDIIIYPKKVMLNLSHEEIAAGINQFISEIFSQKS